MKFGRKSSQSVYELGSNCLLNVVSSDGQLFQFLKSVEGERGHVLDEVDPQIQLSKRIIISDYQLSYPLQFLYQSHLERSFIILSLVTFIDFLWSYKQIESRNTCSRFFSTANAPGSRPPMLHPLSFSTSNWGISVNKDIGGSKMPSHRDMSRVQKSRAEKFMGNRFVQIFFLINEAK